MEQASRARRIGNAVLRYLMLAFVAMLLAVWIYATVESEPWGLLFLLAAVMMLVPWRNRTWTIGNRKEKFWFFSFIALVVTTWVAFWNAGLIPFLK